MKRYQVLIGAAFVIGSLLAAGSIDYVDGQVAHNRYIENVCEGVHPDYKQQGVKCE